MLSTRRSLASSVVLALLAIAGPALADAPSCTVEHWKHPAQLSAWGALQPFDAFATAFDVALPGPLHLELGRKTSHPNLWQALKARRGDLEALAREAVAALLNAQRTDVRYPLTADQVRRAVRDALASGDLAGGAAALHHHNVDGCVPAP